MATVLPDPITRFVFPVTETCADCDVAVAATVTWVVPTGAWNTPVPSRAPVNVSPLTSTSLSVVSLDGAATTTNSE